MTDNISSEELKEKCKKTEAALEDTIQMRARELKCLYSVIDIVNRPTVQLEEMFLALAAEIFSGWRYYEIACARVIFKGREFTSRGFKITQWKQAADIIVNKESVGAIEVYYKEEKPEFEEGPFMKEERLLIELIAHRLSAYIERRWFRDALKKSEERYRTIFEATGTATMIIDEDMTISLVNRQFEELSGYLRKELEDKKKFIEFVSEEDQKKVADYHVRRKTDPDSVPGNYAIKFINRQGKTRHVYLTVAIISGSKQRVISILDTTDLIKARLESEALQEKLEKALTKVISGFLPICASCKKLREPDDSWRQIESYIEEHSEAKFSHSLCPECAVKLYPELYPNGFTKK
ncbi:MAG: PAS domain S-box protein [Desulfobulbaceae bacterium]|nr:PAS domain S-box protein [Desulfobulbaceae bacterium]MCK5436402.1 PAS domain S-box protein [Desulfobulbaceae bacterium]MCK5543968.1 PAS domain S-box protein [Desulfobulbaceae bacterium]